MQQFFPVVQESNTGFKQINVPQHPTESFSTVTTQAQREVRMSVEAFQTIPRSPQTQTVVAGRLPLQCGGMEPGSLKVEDLRALIQALPTRADIEALIYKVEEAHHKELQQVQTVLQALTVRVTEGEAVPQNLEWQTWRE